jgi:predicted ABC-type exoprotein transport system permease subunit
MGTSNIINSIGLVIDIIGVILIFYYGITPMIDENGTVLLAIEQEDDNLKKKAKKFNFLSRLGLILIVIGFVCQLSSNFIKN